MRRRILSAAVAAAAAAAIAFTLAGGGRGEPAYRPGGIFTGTGGPPLPYLRASLSAVSAASRDAAWIVGSVAWRWDGKAWRAAPLPKLGHAVLQSVATVGRDDAWAVGYRGDGYLLRGRALVEHWDGARWTVARLPALGPSILFAVSAAGPSSVWAVGATFGGNRHGRLVPGRTRPLLLHWNGSAWSRQSLPFARRPVELDEVVATGSSSVWAVASGQQRPGARIPGSILVAHWSGTRWREAPPPFGAADFVSGFGATSADDAWAVGSYATGTSPAMHSHALAAHWDGRAWRIVPVPNRSGNTDAVLGDVVALRPGDAWALGQSQHLLITKDGSGTSIAARDPVALFEHWDGRRWRIMPGAAPPLWDGQLRLSVARDGTAWAIGACPVDNVVARWSGKAWTVATHPADRRWRSQSPRRERGPMPSCSPANG